MDAHGKMEQLYNLQQYMQEKEVLQLIQTVVRPLRERIDQLESENQMIKTKIGHINAPLHTQYQGMRTRSRSKQYLKAISREQMKEAKSPATKNRDERNQKPSWNIGKASNPDSVYVRSPSKNAPLLHPPKPAGKPTSTDKPEQARPIEAPKKIVGGKKADPQPHQEQSHNGHTTPPQSEDPKKLSNHGQHKAL